MMKNERTLYVVLVTLSVGGLILASKVGSLSPKNFELEVVTKLLTRFFVLGLFVERTLEVFVAAWRGKETARLEGDLQSKTQALASIPLADTVKFATQQVEVDKSTTSLKQYKCDTQAIALRSGLVLGILVAAVGVRTFSNFVEPPASSGATGWLLA